MSLEEVGCDVDKVSPRKEEEVGSQLLLLRDCGNLTSLTSPQSMVEESEILTLQTRGTATSSNRRHAFLLLCLFRINASSFKFPPLSVLTFEMDLVEVGGKEDVHDSPVGRTNTITHQSLPCPLSFWTSAHHVVLSNQPSHRASRQLARSFAHLA